MLTLKNEKFKKIISHLVIIAMFFTLFSGISLVKTDPTYAFDKVCKVSISKVYVRKSTSTKAKSYGKLKKGTYKLILASKKDSKGNTWYKVYKGSKKGWIPSKSVNIMKFSSTKLTNYKGTVNVLSGSLYVRKGPGSIFGKLGTVKKGKVLTVTNKTKDVYGTYWYAVNLNGKTGYVSSKYLKLSKTSTTEPTTQPTTTKPTTTQPTTTKPTTTQPTTTKPTTTEAPVVSGTNNSTDYSVTKCSLYGVVNVSSGNLNVRKGPSTSYDSVGLLAKNTGFAITGKTTINDVIWYQFDFAKTTAYACGTYIKTSTSKPSGVTMYDGSKTVAARKAACDWAVVIANNNDFHYGETKWAHHNGCYYCGTNTSSGSAKLKDGATKAQAEKTYCCNPFVTAAYCHGAGAPEVNCKVSNMRFGLANDTNYVLKNSPSFVKVTKPSAATSLLPGDILLTPTHCMLYIGDGKIAHAAHHDNDVRNDYWNDSIKVEKIPSTQWSRTTLIYRYIGNGKY